MKTIFEMASEIKRDPRTSDLRLILTKSSNDAYDAPADFYWEAKWDRVSVQSACGHAGHRDYPKSFRSTSETSAEAALGRIYQLHLLTDAELAHGPTADIILYYDGNEAEYHRICAGGSMLPELE